MEFASEPKRHSPDVTDSTRDAGLSVTSPSSPWSSPNSAAAAAAAGRTPSASSPRSVYSDRYIPHRTRNLAGGVSFRSTVQALNKSFEAAAGVQEEAQASNDAKDEIGKMTYNMLLRNEVLGGHIDTIKDERFGSAAELDDAETENLFRFKADHTRATGASEPASPFSLSPVGVNSQKLLSSPRKTPRKISKHPFKVLDAPDLRDDFYLHLVDWSSQNVLCVGLESCVYLWSACTSQVTKLCDMRGEADAVTSVRWMQRGSHLAVGTSSGLVQIWDAQKCKLVRTMTGHTGRVGAISWNGNTFASGSRDRNILLRDVRVSDNSTGRLSAHKQEVCGLEWSPDGLSLASGGNDNKLFVWNVATSSPMHRFSEHKAAVKAIAWSPHQHGLLASGGGTADQCIRFWNTLTGQPIQCVDTKSQVCNLAWSKTSNELVSTHGYSQNQVIVWRYPSMTQVATLTGHTTRVLYLAMSPDGQTIVTGAGDETLRFWNVFSKSRSTVEAHSALNMFSHIR
eukprot:m.136394 g.136394  ORF g.136394 m.136394 type:complete len:511 (-) comp16585_c0_seq1:600-2132(-)